MKTYIIYWLEGKSLKITGNTIADAFTKAGYGGGAASAIDFYEQADEPTHTWSGKEWVPINQQAD